MSIGTKQRLTVREPQLSESAAIAGMYEAALGAGGIYAPGCDQYPDPDLFTAEGICRIIASPERQLLVAESDGEIVGGAIIDWLDPHHCEINCAAVARHRRGGGICSKIFDEAKRVIDRNTFVVNTTEFVTHSLASQSAYMPDGRGQIVGFSYCHYPHVFFPNHPESVLWISSLHGQLPRSLSAVRRVYVPLRYSALAESILHQFSDWLNYEIESVASNSCVADTKARLHIDWKGDYRYCHLTFDSNFNLAAKALEIDEAVRSLIAKGKKFIFARIRMNDPSALAIADHLSKLGFVFHSILPLYFENAESTEDDPAFDDVLGMQWVHADVLADNPWPGETNSVIKLFGYPQNLSGAVVKAIRRELEALHRS